MTAHEVSEAITDPTIDAWLDNAGNEVGDKCNFVFAPSPTFFPGNGTSWKIQDEWSNSAYNQGDGDIPGCVSESP